uniref:Uncharacterized protein n=1 Tax=Oryza punctata TaxID=4537 RepID=A0A0E0M0X9_ORYPU
MGGGGKGAAVVAAAALLVLLLVGAASLNADVVAVRHLGADDDGGGLQTQVPVAQADVPLSISKASSGHSSCTNDPNDPGRRCHPPKMPLRLML